MITTQNITLDLHTQSYFSCMVYAKQGDDATRQIRVTLTESGQPYTIPDGVSASFRCLKPDGTCCESPALIDEEKAITVVLTEQILAVPGAISADICLEDGEGDTLSTASFVIRVEPVPFGIEVESINEFLELRAIVVKNKELTGEYETALAQLLAIQSASETAADLAQAAAQNASASESSASQAAQAAAVSEQNAQSAAGAAQDYAESIDPTQLSAMIGQKADNFWQDPQTGLLYLTSGGEIISDGILVQGTGGGGGSSLTYTVTIQNLLESRVLTVPEGERVVLRFSYSSVDDEGMDDGSGLGQVLVGGIVQQTFSAVQGENTVEITGYLASGTNNVSVRITNSENAAKSMAYTVTVAAVSLTSFFDASVPYSGEITFPFTPVGIAAKTVHFEVDGAEIGAVTVTTSGRQASYTIPAQSHGAHVLRVWFTCEISGASVSSNVLYYSVICLEEGKTAAIIAVTSPPVSSVEQYSNVIRKYRVYDPASLTAAITLEANGETVASLTVDRTEQTWTYRPIQVGELIQTIRCGGEQVSWSPRMGISASRT